MTTSVWMRWVMQQEARPRVVDPEALEAEIAALLAAGDEEEATLRALEGWGRELLGTLLLLLGDQARATEAFSTVERMARREIAKPSWPHSTRVWLHILAKRAADEAPLVARPTPTPPCTPTWPSAIDDRSLPLPTLREALELEDELRLVLRIRRKFSWPAIAAIVEGIDPADEVALSRAADVQRRRHRDVEARLRAIHRGRRGRKR